MYFDEKNVAVVGLELDEEQIEALANAVNARVGQLLEMAEKQKWKRI